MNAKSALAGFVAGAAAATALVGSPALADQTPAPQCYDAAECRVIIKRLVTEGDNLRSDVLRLQTGVDQANNHLRVLQDNLAGRDREIAGLQRDLGDRTSQRDSWITYAGALQDRLDEALSQPAPEPVVTERVVEVPVEVPVDRVVADPATEARAARLAAQVRRLQARLALPDTACRTEDSLDCVWVASRRGNGRGHSYYVTARGESKRVSHARAARMIAG